MKNWKGRGKKLVVTEHEVLSRRLHGGTEEIYEKTQDVRCPARG
jgi:hypothetical protein